MTLHVEHHIDETGAEVPRSLCLGRRRIAIVEIIDQWPGAGYRYVKVSGDDGAIYILRHDIPAETWQLTMYATERGQMLWGEARRWTRA